MLQSASDSHQELALDPPLTVIKVMPTAGDYWDTKGAAVAGVKMLVGAVLRKTMEDSIQGKLDVGWVREL